MIFPNLCPFMFSINFIQFESIFQVLPKKQKQLIEIPAAVRLWEEFEPVIIKSEDLLLTDILGAGNFGEVYKGSWTRRSGGHEAKVSLYLSYYLHLPCK